MLRAFEEGTPFSNKTELYIKLMKEAVRKDIKETHCPLRFWNYCLDQRGRIYNLTSRDHIKIHGSIPHTEALGTKVTCPTSVSSNGTIGVILEIIRLLSLTIKKCSVASSALLKGKEMNLHNGSSSLMAMLYLAHSSACAIC